MGNHVLEVLPSTFGRPGTVEDIPVIAFLGSHAAQWINGQDVPVDSGFISSMAVGVPIPL